MRLHENQVSVGGDLAIIREAVRQYAWGFEKGCTVLDVGANIGAVTKLALLLGAAHVFCVEPVESNFQLLQHNLSLYTNTTLLQRIVVGPSFRDDKRSIYIPDNEINMGSCSVFRTSNKTQEEKVRCIHFSELLFQTQPTVLKLDIEGAEWDILLGVILPSCVLKVTIECHFPSHLFKTEACRINGMMRLFRQFSGWKSCLKYPLKNVYTNWHILVRFWREPRPPTTKTMVHIYPYTHIYTHISKYILLTAS